MVRCRPLTAGETWIVAATDVQIIELRLERAHDLLEMPQTDLFSEYRNFLTGVDFCISALRARPSRKPVLLSITLPPSEITEGLDTRMRDALARYCHHRIGYNHRERRALRYEGVTSFGIGLPITAVGLAVAAWATGLGASSLTLATFRVVPWNAPRYAHRGWTEVPEAEVQAVMAARVMDLMGYTFTTANATQVPYRMAQTEPQVTTVQTALTET